MRILPADFQVNPGPTDDNITDTEKDADNNKILAEGKGETEVGDWFDDNIEDEDSPSNFHKDAIEGGDKGDEEAGEVQVQVQCCQKKNKGDSLPALIKAMQKHPRPVGGNLKQANVSLVAKVPPIPALKGKKTCGMYVFTSVPMLCLSRVDEC
jgi:hypothetical protein